MGYPRFSQHAYSFAFSIYSILLVSMFTLVDFPVSIIDPFNSQLWTEIVARH